MPLEADKRVPGLLYPAFDCKDPNYRPDFRTRHYTLKALRRAHSRVMVTSQSPRSHLTVTSSIGSGSVAGQTLCGLLVEQDAKIAQQIERLWSRTKVKC